MKYFRTYWFRQFLLGYILFSLINISIDPPDYLVNVDNDVELEEDLSLNEMESISELFLEKVLDISNAVPENEESEADAINKMVDFAYNQTHYTLITIFLDPFGTTKQIPFNERCCSFSISPPSQPPPYFIL